MNIYDQEVHFHTGLGLAECQKRLAMNITHYRGHFRYFFADQFNSNKKVVGRVKGADFELWLILPRGGVPVRFLGTLEPGKQGTAIEGHFEILAKTVPYTPINFKDVLLVAIPVSVLIFLFSFSPKFNLFGALIAVAFLAFIVFIANESPKPVQNIIAKCKDESMQFLEMTLNTEYKPRPASLP